MRTLEWPSRSLTTLGCVPWASIRLAWACRKSWNRRAQLVSSRRNLLPSSQEISRVDRRANSGSEDQIMVLISGSSKLAIGCLLRAMLSEEPNAPRG